MTYYIPNKRRRDFIYFLTIKFMWRHDILIVYISNILWRPGVESEDKFKTKKLKSKLQPLKILQLSLINMQMCDKQRYRQTLFRPTLDHCVKFSIPQNNHECIGTFLYTLWIMSVMFHGINKSRQGWSQICFTLLHFEQLSQIMSLWFMVHCFLHGWLWPFPSP